MRAASSAVRERHYGSAGRSDEKEPQAVLGIARDAQIERPYEDFRVHEQQVTALVYFLQPPFLISFSRTVSFCVVNWSVPSRL
jgi:hypothetical protein